MEVAVIIWLAFSAFVGWAASTRGHCGLCWFLLSLILSPLICGILILLLPRAKDPRRRADDEPVFHADGVYAGIPFRRTRRGAVEAKMPNGLVRFRSMDQFTAAAAVNAPQAAPQPANRA